MDSNKPLDQIEVVAEPDGSAEIHIPAPCFWECVECFGVNRIEVSFTFDAPIFVGHAHHASAPRVAETLHNWMGPEPAESAHG